MGKAVDHKTRWQRRKDQRPGEILTAALECFVENGFNATRLDEVARRAGVSKGTVYLYYESKEALLRAVVQEMVVPEIEQFEAIVAQYQGTAESLLRELVTTWWKRVGESNLNGIPKLVIGEAHNFPELAEYFVKEVVQRARRMFTHVLEMGMDQGEFRRMNPQYATRLLVAPIVYAAIWKRSLQPYDDELYNEEDYFQYHLDLFLNGLLVAPKGSGQS